MARSPHTIWGKVVAITGGGRGTDRALLDAADNPDRCAYLQRISGPAELPAPVAGWAHD